MPQSSFDSTDLPVLEPRTHCVLIPRDPNFIYAYWDYTGEDIDRARNQLKFESGDSRLVLRVYDITLIDFNGSNANHTWDLDVGFSTKDWYIHVWQDNADYCAELGVSCGEDHFIPLTRSNIVRTPPKSSSKRDDLIWQDIKAHSESLPYLKENIAIKQQLSGKKSHLAKKTKKARIHYLTAQDIRAYYMKLFSRVSRRGKRRLRGMGNAPSLEDILKGRFRGGSWQKVRPLITISDLITRTHPGSSQPGLEKKGASENLFSSQAQSSEGRLNKRKFFFEIWTELIVHGRTEPDAAVWLGQKGIQLNPDGTFSLRYSLPDGEISLKFIAQSSDGVEERHIYTRVEREKTIDFPKLLKEFDG
ncbi:MAG: DUF4912 domain-containing protein [Candidatus Omnitrophica bacterium]|nr:DUF4912 domain-containing protein [Candidatus Omnitrophota bacterium]